MAAPRSPSQPGRSTRAYPLKWIEDTFNSKEKAESLLRPEVENGNVTYHDMELAQSFFSSKRRYLPILYSNLAFLGTVVYSQRFARPKWRLAKLVAISTCLGFGSYTLGFNQKLSAHFRFARTLEDPAGFNKALRNINVRLGGSEHFPYGVPERQEELMGFAIGPRVTKDFDANGSPLETTEPGEDWAASPVQEPDQNQARQTSQPSVQRPPNKWDEIRAVNNKGGSLSSWDLIRQSHERDQIASPSSSQSPTRPLNPNGADGTSDHGSSPPDPDSSIAIDKGDKQWDNRAVDEAQFSAVLEAERRRASQPDTSLQRAERSPPH